MNLFELPIDLSKVTHAAIGRFASAEPLLFFLTLLVALAFSSLVWSQLAQFCQRFHRRYLLGRWAHLVLLVVAVLSTLLVVSIPSYSRLSKVVGDNINRWRQGLLEDESFSSDTFRKGYAAVKALNVEDFRNYPPPELGGTLVPLNDRRSIEALAIVYAEAVDGDFQRNNPFLDKYLGNPTRDLKQLARMDVAQFLQTRGKIYPLSRAIDRVSEAKRQDALKKVPQVIIILQLVAGLALILPWAATYGAFARHAYLKLNPNQPAMANPEAASLAGY